jgi:hypothetical protein
LAAATSIEKTVASGMRKYGANIPSRFMEFPR